MKRTVKKVWKDISIGDEFVDGSVVKSIHDSYNAECYKVFYGLFNKKSMILSDSHLLLCDISKLDDESKLWVDREFGNYKIPTLYNKHMYFNNLSGENETYSHSELEIIQSDYSKVSINEYWLPTSAIFMLTRELKQKIYCNKNKLYLEYCGVKEVFCVETNTHKFETNELIHHNSVALRDIIFHTLTHGQEMSIALIDLKYTEFTPFKGVKNVVAVANTVREAAEVLRIARECMYKRNQELAKLGLNDIKNFKPQKSTDEVIVAGRRLNENEKVEIKVNGEVKEVTVKELEQYLE